MRRCFLWSALDFSSYFLFFHGILCGEAYSESDEFSRFLKLERLYFCIYSVCSGFSIFVLDLCSARSVCSHCNKKNHYKTYSDERRFCPSSVLFDSILMHRFSDDFWNPAKAQAAKNICSCNRKPNHPDIVNQTSPRFWNSWKRQVLYFSAREIIFSFSSCGHESKTEFSAAIIGAMNFSANARPSSVRETTTFLPPPLVRFTRFFDSSFASAEFIVFRLIP